MVVLVTIAVGRRMRLDRSVAAARRRGRMARGRGRSARRDAPSEHRNRPSCGGIDVQPQATAPRTSSRFSALGQPSRNVPSCRESRASLKPSRRTKGCRNVGPSQEHVHDVKADGPMVRMSEGFRDGGENREAEQLPQADAVAVPGSQCARSADSLAFDQERRGEP
jgi:hypothetical protein